ncbi:MAG: hypothetical protein ABIB46_02235 [bacterium]
MIKQKSVKRRKFLIIPEFQLKYSFYISFILMVFILFAEYFVFQSVSNILPSVYSSKVANLLKYSRITFTFIGIFYIVVIAILSVYFTHRVAGPIYRFKKEIDQIGINDGLNHKFYVRKNDELKEIVNSLNLMFERFDVQVSEIRIILDSLKNDITNDNKDNCLEKINNLINKIDLIRKGG